MKKFFAITLSLLLCLFLAACGGDSETQQDASNDQGTQETSEPEDAAENTETNDSDTDASAEGSGTVGDYDIEIKSAALAQDYEGNPAIIITYAWTNNSNDTTNAMTSMYSQAFQDGVELETAMILDSDVYDSDASMKDVRPGTTIDIQAAYVLDSETSVVEFEVSEWLTFKSNPPVVSMDFDPAAL